jgi:hypothetical protein
MSAHQQLAAALVASALLSACPLLDATSGFMTCGPEGWATERYPGADGETPQQTECTHLNYGIDVCGEGAEWCWDEGAGAAACDVHGATVEEGYLCVPVVETEPGPCESFIGDLNEPMAGDVVIQYGRLTLAPRDAVDPAPACHEASFLVGGDDAPKTAAELEGTISVITNLHTEHIVLPSAIIIDSVVAAAPDTPALYPSNVLRASVCIPVPDDETIGEITAVAVRVEKEGSRSNVICLREQDLL